MSKASDTRTHTTQRAGIPRGLNGVGFGGLVAHGRDTQRWDVDGDLQVTSVDVDVVTAVFLGTETDPSLVARSDVNQDGQVNVSDVQVMVNRVALIDDTEWPK